MIMKTNSILSFTNTILTNARIITYCTMNCYFCNGKNIFFAIVQK